MKIDSGKDTFMRLFTTPLILILPITIALSGEVFQNQLLAAAAKKISIETFKGVINRMVVAYNKKDYLGMRRDFADVMQQAFPPEKSTPFFRDLYSGYGEIKQFDTPKFIPPNQATTVARCERGLLDIKLVLDNRKKIVSLWLTRHGSDIPVPVNHKTALSLPFKGRWKVLWGGDTEQLNRHHKVSNQKFAFDFLGADDKARTRLGSGITNKHFFAFGREVLAPAAGIVTDVISGVRDNKPGSMNPYFALGNAVFIQHAENEVSVLAHLKFKSITVNVGDKVKAGQKIGLCGNSGNSSEPHIHFHLQNTPVIQDATGIKCYFRKISVIENGQKQSRENYSPIKGQFITTD